MPARIGLAGIELQSVETIQRDQQASLISKHLDLAVWARQEAQDGRGQYPFLQGCRDDARLVLIGIRRHSARVDLLDLQTQQMAPKVVVVDAFVEIHASAKRQLPVPVWRIFAGPIMRVDTAEGFDPP